MSCADQSIRILIVDGEIAAGKSTLCARIATYLTEVVGVKAVTVLEPVEDWVRTGCLSRYYSNPSHYIFESQIYIMSTLVRAFNEARLANPDAKVFVLERSVLTCRHVFYEIMKGELEPGRQEMFESFYTWLMKPSLVYGSGACSTKHLYLKPSIELCQERLRLRNREAEASVSEAYQSKLRRCTETFFSEHVPASDLLVLDSDNENSIDFRSMDNVGVADLMRKITNFVNDS